MGNLTHPDLKAITVFLASTATPQRGGLPYLDAVLPAEHRLAATRVVRDLGALPPDAILYLLVQPLLDLASDHLMRDQDLTTRYEEHFEVEDSEEWTAAMAEYNREADATGRVAVLRRQVSRHDAPECLARPLTIGRALPDASPARQGEADRLGRERLLGFELTVDGAMSHAGTPADRVDAGRADAVLAEQARGRGQDLLPILHRSLLGDPHPPSSLVPIPLTWL